MSDEKKDETKTTPTDDTQTKDAQTSVKSE